MKRRINYLRQTPVLKQKMRLNLEQWVIVGMATTFLVVAGIILITIFNASQAKAGVNSTNDDFANDAGNQTSQNRIDNSLGGALGISYNPVRWLGIKGQYQYQQRLSTIDSFEFYANTLMVSIDGVF